MDTSITRTKTIHGGFVLEEDVVIHEILTRLPMRSLIRFKSVCKLWNSVIPNPSLMIILKALDRKSRGDEYSILTGEIESCTQGGRLTTMVAIDSTMKTKLSNPHNKSTNFINGLVCFFGSGSSKHPSLYNLITGEETQLLLSPELKNEKGGRLSDYQLGFDPVTNNYKLVSMWLKLSSSNKFEQVCDVLTLNSGGCRVNNNNNNSKVNAWRRIDQVVPDTAQNPSVHVNGTIYWSTYNLKYGYWTREVFIIAFDVGSEKFRYIQVPEFILDWPGKHSKTKYHQRQCAPDPNIDLLEVGGRVALQIKTSSYIVKLWLFHDEKKENTTTSDKNWTEVSINLPFCYKDKMDLRLHAILDQIVIRAYDLTTSHDFNKYGDTKEKHNVSHYAFDMKKNTLTKLDIGGIPSLIFPSYLYSTSSFTTCVKVLGTFRT